MGPLDATDKKLPLNVHHISEQGTNAHFFVVRGECLNVTGC